MTTMSDDKSLPRRRFLAAAGVAAATGASVSCSRAGKAYRFLTDAEAATLEAICAEIIPADEDPGAVEAGVVNFIDRQLVGHYQRLQQDYAEGLARLEQSANSKYGSNLAQLPSERRIEFLKGLEKERDPFFAMLVDHTMQGFYGSPRHGGNRNAVSWKMLGVPTPPVRGRRPVQNS